MKKKSKKIMLPSIKLSELSKEAKEAIFLVLNSLKYKYTIKDDRIEIETDRNEKEVIEEINNSFFKCLSGIYLLKYLGGGNLKNEEDSK